jgi:hypothetical protein
MRKLPIVGQREEDPKTLMPEVLPEPPAGQAAGSSPRQRTVKHMRKLLAAAAVAGIAATTTRSQATDAGPDASTDAGTDAVAEDATDEGDADAELDADAAKDTGPSYYDGPLGHDPAPPPPDGSMFVGHDPAGQPPGTTTGDNSGCGCSVVGKKSR